MMEEKLVNILNEMAEYLSVAQLKKLQEVLLTQLTDLTPEHKDIDNPKIERKVSVHALTRQA